MKIYIAGPITGVEGYKERFDSAERILQEQGHKTMNPAILPGGFEHHEYMKICFSMVDVCEAVVMLSGWERSKGAEMEYQRALEKRKKIGYHDPGTKKVLWLK